MAGKPVTDLPAVTSVEDGDLLYLERGGADFSLPGSLIGGVSQEPVFYVSRGSRASDSNDGLSFQRPFATLAAARAALGANGGKIVGGAGTFHLTDVDADGYTFALDDTQHFEGLGPGVTTISVDVSATWGPMCRGLFASISECSITNDPAATVTYLCGISTPSPPHTSSLSRITRVVVNPQGAGQVTAGFADGPDFPGHSDMDIATSVFTECYVLPAAVGVCESAYRLGNGTVGNVLQTAFIDCAAAFCRWGVWMGGPGVFWSGGGMTGITEADFFDAIGGGESIHIAHYRGEEGAMLVKRGYVGSRYGGVVLNDASALDYAPPDGETVISIADCDLQIIGGELLTIDSLVTRVPTDAKIEMNPFGGDPRTFTAINLTTSSLDPYRGIHPVITGVVINASYRPGDAGAPSPIAAYTFTVIGGGGPAPIYLTASEFTPVIGTPTMATISGWWVGLTFDSTDDEYASATFQVPADWNTAEVTIEWTNDGSGSGDVVWFGQVWNTSAGELLDVSDPGETGAILATAGAAAEVVSSLLVPPLTVVPGAVCNLMILRAPTTQPPDTLPNDAMLLGVRITKAS